MDRSSLSWGLRSGKKFTSFSKNGSLKNCSKKRWNEKLRLGLENWQKFLKRFTYH
jgi:hypothetical protein